MPTTDSVIRFQTLEQGRALREFFQESGYNMKSLGPLLGLRANMALLLHQTREPNRLNTLLRWFVIGRPVDEKTAAEFIPGEILQLLLETNLLARDGGTLAPTVLLLPFADLLTACDHAVEKDKPPADVVIGPNAPAASLLSFTIRRKLGAALDLCCGGGVHAIKLASHCDTVVGTDLNERALDFARFNARLHGAENIEFLKGDSFTPVAGRSFDLIVANPPFYLLPTTELLYRDNPLDLDGFAREIARQAPLYLNEGGVFQMVLEWVEIEGQLWQERLAEWFSGSGCDVWMLRHYDMRPIEYCEARLRSGGLAMLDRDLETIGTWSGYYARHRVARMHGGVIAMRKRTSAKNWTELEETMVNIRGDFGDIVEAFFESQDFGLDADDEALLASRPRLSPHARLEQVSAASDEGWLAPSIELRSHHGLPRNCAVNQQVAGFLSRLNGKRTMRELLEFVSPQQGVDAGQVRSQCLAIMRQLIRRGFVLVQTTKSTSAR